MKVADCGFLLALFSVFTRIYICIYIYSSVLFRSAATLFLSRDTFFVADSIRLVVASRVETKPRLRLGMLLNRVCMCSRDKERLADHAVVCLCCLCVARSRQAVTATQNSRLLKDVSRLQNFHPRLHLQLHFLLSSKKNAMKSVLIIYIINKIMNLKGQCHEVFVSIFLENLSWFK